MIDCRFSERIFVTIICMTVLIALMAYAIAALYNLSLHPVSPIPELAITRDNLMMSVFPEPLEKLIYVFLVIVTPLILMLIVYFSEKYTNSCSSFPIIKNYYFVKYLLPIIVTLMFAIPFYGSDLLSILFHWSPANKSYFLVTLALATLCSLGIITFNINSYRFINHKIKRYNTNAIVFIILGLAIFLQLCSFRLFNINSVTGAVQWSVSFDAAIYAISQVATGKTLLADLPSQYGLFPEIIAPIFKLTGLSVLKIVILFGCLQIVSLCALIVVMKKYIRSNVLILICGLTVILTTGCTFLYLIGITNEPYFQYFPIRFFWPSLSLLLFHWYSLRPTYFHLSIFSVTAAVACLWNLDSGIPIVASFSALLCCKLVFSNSKTDKVDDVRLRLSHLRHLTVHLAIVCGVILFFFCFLYIKSDGRIDLSLLLKYQKIFYGIGFGMMPLPMPIHPWMAVLGVYLTGITVAFYTWKWSEHKNKSDMLFYLSILGAGLFTYYQGRSHTFNLIHVLWPALIVGAILTDMTLHSIKLQIIAKPTAVVTVPYLLFVSLGAINLAAGLPELVQGVYSSIINFKEPKDSLVVEELDFIRSHLYGRRECLILSQRQAIYYTELGLGSPFGSPGLIEIILKRDLDELITKALYLPISCIFLGVGNETSSFLKIDQERLFVHYDIIAKNPRSTIFLLEPKL